MLCLLVCCISITKKSDMSATVIYHAMSLSMLYQYHQEEWYVCHSDFTVADISLFLVILIQHTKRHSMINHCDRHITLLSNTDTAYKRHSMINHCGRHITLLSDTDTVIYHAMSLSMLYQYHQEEWYVCHSDLSSYMSLCLLSNTDTAYKRHSMINHCGRHITLLSDTDTAY
jgi:hypothetical protein